MANFSDRLKELRKSKNLLQKELANEINTPLSTIASWESGIRNPEINAAQKLADFFEVSLDYLLGRSDTRNVDLPNTNIKEAEELIKVDPDLFIDMCRAKELPDEVRRRIRDFAAFELEKHLREKQKGNDNKQGKT